MTDRKKGSSEFVSRRRFLSTGSVALVGACVARDGWGQSAASSPSYVEAETTYGRVRGAHADGIVRFKGVPYGGSVSGPNRFKAAPAMQPWTGVRDALQFGAPALQPGRGRTNELPYAEDCLFLNIWTPAADGRKRPVMFYNHGGGFTSGSGATGYQDGSSMARTWDVVVVASNHRLGLMGYLYLGDLGSGEYATSGNQGLEDIRDALRWVHDNVERFGGDPDNVMVFGESGGGAKTSCLYAMPSAAPYFNKASIESGPGIRLRSSDTAMETTALVLKQLGLDKSQWRQLLEIPADKLVEAQAALAQNAPTGSALIGQNRAAASSQTSTRNGMTGGAAPGAFGPVLDGHVMPNDPFYPTAPAISKKKPLMIGYNRDEMNFFFAQRRQTDIYSLTEDTLKQRLDNELGANADKVLAAYKKSRPDASPADLYVAIATARFDVTGSITIAERKYAQHGAPVYMYCYAHEARQLIPGTQHIYGAGHGLEIVYKLNNIPPLPNAQSAQGTPIGVMYGDADPSSVKTAHNMSEMWSTFARTGRPAAKGQPAWPPYTTENRATMFIDAECKVVDDPYSPERHIWDQIEPT
jgi:para-nitrobenzyl esterase